MTEATSSEALVRAWAACLLGDAAQASNRLFNFGRECGLAAHSPFRNMLFKERTSAMMAGELASHERGSCARWLNIYQHGAHGLGLGTKSAEPAQMHPWTRECQRWLKERGFGK